MEFKNFIEDKYIDDILKMLLDKNMIKEKIDDAPLSQIGSFLNVILTNTLKIDENYIDKEKTDNLVSVVDLILNPVDNNNENDD